MTSQGEGSHCKLRSGASEDTNPAHNLILNFQSPEPRINKCLLFKATWSLVFCYGSPSKLIQSLFLMAPHLLKYKDFYFLFIIAYKFTSLNQQMKIQLCSKYIRHSQEEKLNNQGLGSILIQDDLILTCLHLRRSYVKMKSHSEAPGVRTSMCLRETQLYP